MKAVRIALYGALVLLYLLHTDLWNWDNDSLVLGFPVTLAYHLGFCIVTIALMASLVRWAWPFEDDEVDP